jgi:hypothetical protein
MLVLGAAALHAQSAEGRKVFAFGVVLDKCRPFYAIDQDAGKQILDAQMASYSSLRRPETLIADLRGTLTEIDAEIKRDGAQAWCLNAKRTFGSDATYARTFK